MPYHHYSFAFTNNGPDRGGSRLLWFILGGVATALWMKHRERRTLKNETRPALPAPGPYSTADSAQLRERLARMNAETSAAAMDVADATLDAALRIVTALKSTLAEHRVETEQLARQATPQVNPVPNNSGPAVRSASPSFIASFHHVEAVPSS
ncbi:hypothetical protein FS749_012244 [Ceratobasidium sp. UAMH 11750]|nr:hypothetical protein FS749_012244 [Ceratobasidium sp. UAMH 11750]